MFGENARLFFQLIFHIEPDNQHLYGHFPEDDPKHIVYKFEVIADEDNGIAGFEKYICVTIGEDQLGTRIVEEKEIKELERLQANSNLDTEEVDIKT